MSLAIIVAAPVVWVELVGVSSAASLGGLSSLLGIGRPCMPLSVAETVSKSILPSPRSSIEPAILARLSRAGRPGLTTVLGARIAPAVAVTEFGADDGHASKERSELRSTRCVLRSSSWLVVSARDKLESALEKETHRRNCRYCRFALGKPAKEKDIASSRSMLLLLLLCTAGA